MKKVFTFVSLLSLSSLTFIPSVSLADPVGLRVEINCPTRNELANFGDYVAGNGYEVIQDRFNTIYFKSSSLPTLMPAKLDTYRSESTEYDSTSGRVTCYYNSLAQDPRFSVAYTLTNGRGGSVISQSESNIAISLPFGLRG
ncbi:hypothetical protein [Aquicella lusitana]|uniref:Uncharacterized protein n=1 Tax=Aquicella lusitana TaxID=254246 RepID=A0A370GLS8_9COXI|nr:hypothetical protein [Aquicella lusitana]RDI42853.1 hypothetical protein C8D86_11251 [Aquicella lusitana]VVC73096.1 hypothetical protein AQULUS_08270 [Aquicella lusitana]